MPFEHIEMVALVLFLLCVTYAFSLGQQNKILNIAKHEAHRWCSLSSEHKIFTLGNWFQCPFSSVGSFTDVSQPGKQLRVAILENVKDSLHDCWAVKEGQALVPKGSYSTFILEILQELLQVKIQLIGESSYGRNETGHWSGLMGLLVRNEADIAVCHLTVTGQRIQAVDFLHSTLSTNRAFIFSPRRLPLTEDVFVLTFSANLWLCFLAATVLLIICFRFSTWLHSKVRPDHEPWSWIEVILLVIASICQQSFSRHPKGLSCRTTFIIGYMITYLLYTAFAAGVTSLLAVQDQDIELTFDDVMNMKLSLLVSSHTTDLSVVTTFPDTSTKWIHHNWKRIYFTREVDNNDELFRGLEEENVVGFGTDINLKNYLWRRLERNKRTEFTFSAIFNSKSQESFIVQKNSPYKEITNYWLLRMQEAGLLVLGKARYINVPQERFSDAPGWSSAGLGNVLSAILILSAGYFFSIFILFCEMAWMRKNSGSKWEEYTRQDVTRQYQHFHGKRRHK